MSAAVVDSWLPKLRPQLENLCTAWSVPLGVPVGWIQVESGGRLDEVTKLDERGYFQLMPSESKDLGLQHERLSSDSMYSLASGFKLINYYSRAVGRVCRINSIQSVRVGSEYHWRLVKLGHSMGLGATQTILIEAAKAQATNSWDALKSYALAYDTALTAKTKHSPAKWFPFIDRMFEIGAPYGLSPVAPAIV